MGSGSITELESRINRLEAKISEKQIDSNWMTFNEVVVYLKAKESHVRSLVYRNKIPYSKLGELLRFHRPTIDDWLLTSAEPDQHVRPRKGAKRKCLSKR